MTSQFAEVDDHNPAEVATTPGSITYINEAGVPEDILLQLRNNRDIANQIERWSQSLSRPVAQTLDVFNRGRWEAARHPFAIMSNCAWAVENDDILGTLADVVEGLTFGNCRFEACDEDQEDVWNQWSEEVNMDSVLRTMFRELYKVSHVYVGVLWGTREYTVRDEPVADAVELLTDEIKAKETGKPAPTRKGNRTRRKKYTLQVPTAFTVFEPTKILPVGALMFGRQRYAYIASPLEDEAFTAAMRGDVIDSMVLNLVKERYEPTPADIQACQEMGIDWSRLWLMRRDAIFAHTLTKADYERFAAIRLKVVLPLLEMKDHLRASDRAALIGSTNFIVVITKGTDKLPAKAAEVENLQEQARVIARMPVLVGDHRLHVEIVAPPLDNTMIESRWQVIDSRLVFRALGTFTPLVQGGNSSGTGVSEMSRVVSRGLENRRKQMVGALRRFVFRPIVDRNDDLDEPGTLEFTPRRITLDFQTDIVSAMLKLRDRGDISRETTLEELDFVQDVEVLRRAKEKAQYDEVFQSATPFSSPAANPYGADKPGGAVGPDGKAPGGKSATPGGKKKPAATNLPGGGSPKGERTGRPPGTKEDGPRKPAGTVKA